MRATRFARSTDGRLVVILVAAFSTSQLGCHDPTPPPPPDLANPGCTLAYLGDPNKPIELEIFELDVNHSVADIAECGPVDIVAPPQGGYVLFVGVRATNLDPCGAQLTAALSDPANNEKLLSTPDARTTLFEPIANRPGWGATTPSGDATNGYALVANLPVCPSDSLRDIQQLSSTLQVLIKDRGGKKAQLNHHVFPRCAQSDSVARAACECTCKGDYKGMRCTNVTMYPDSPDAGTCYPPDAAMAPDASVTPDASVPDLAVSDGKI